MKLRKMASAEASLTMVAQMEMRHRCAQEIRWTCVTREDGTGASWRIGPMDKSWATPQVWDWLARNRWS